MTSAAAPARARAPRMSGDERRTAIVRAALPLVSRDGSAVLTAEVARAAGIAEGTLFRVFEDKDALLVACLAHVADTSELEAVIAAIDEDDLERAVVRAVEVVLAHLVAAMPVVMRVTRTGPTPKAAYGLRAELTERTRDELASVLDRHSDELGVPVAAAADVLHCLVLGAAVQRRPPAAADLARAFVHGCGG